MSTALPSVPANLVNPSGGLLHGLWAGRVADDPVRIVRTRGGRVRRWSYAAAGDDHVAVGACTVDVGVGATAFVWCVVERQLWTWEHTVVGGRGVTVPERPSGRGAASVGGATVTIEPTGGMRIDAPVTEGRLRADLVASAVGTPAVCGTPTPAGGWNVTQKHAGYPVRGTVAIGRRALTLDGGGWSDWTAGRQDRDTSWRWAAGAGTVEEHRVGLNVSTGMNGSGPGEDVVWWDGVPHALDVTELTPVGAGDGAWSLAGRGWGLTFDVAAVRAADERMVLLSSSYVQPIGRFEGSLPGPDGEPVNVSLVGVCEDHRATW